MSIPLKGKGEFSFLIFVLQIDTSYVYFPPQVMVTVKSPEEAAIMKKLYPSLRKLSGWTMIQNVIAWLLLAPHAVRIIDMSSTQNVTEVCLQETGGLGVDCIIDNGGEETRVN